MLSCTNFFFQNPLYSYIQEHPLTFVYFLVFPSCQKNSCPHRSYVCIYLCQYIYILSFNLIIYIVVQDQNRQNIKQIFASMSKIYKIYNHQTDFDVLPALNSYAVIRELHTLTSLVRMYGPVIALIIIVYASLWNNASGLLRNGKLVCNRPWK